MSSKGSDARESKVSKGNPEQAPGSFARSLCSLASLAPRNNNTHKKQAQQATLNKNIPQQPKVTKNNKNELKLTFTEFQILYLLASHPGWVFTRYQIIDKIRSDNNSVTDRSVDFQIVGLRKKMNNLGKLIETIRGVGYRFKSKDF